jgi:hypothetical protein
MSPAGFGLGAGYTPVEEVEETEEVAASELAKDEAPAVEEHEKDTEVSEGDTEEELIISDDDEESEDTTSSDGNELIETGLTKQELLEKLAGEDAEQITDSSGEEHAVAREGEDRLYLEDLSPVFARENSDGEWEYYRLIEETNTTPLSFKAQNSLVPSKEGEPVKERGDDEAVAHTDDKTGDFLYHDGRQVFYLGDEGNKTLVTFSTETSISVLPEDTEYYTAKDFLGEDYLAQISKYLQGKQSVLYKETDGSIQETNTAAAREEETLATPPEGTSAKPATLENVEVANAYIRHVNIDEVGIPPIKTKSRTAESLDGLKNSMQQNGMLVPILLVESDAYRENKNTEEVFSAGPKYWLVDGLRRLHAHNMLHGKKDFLAIVRSYDADVEHLLPQIIRRVQTIRPMNVLEKYATAKILLAQEGLTLEAVEFLCELSIGDYTRLQAILEAPEKHAEAREKLLEGKLDKSAIAAAYNILVKLQKEEELSELDKSTGDNEEAIEPKSDSGDEEEGMSSVESLESLGMTFAETPEDVKAFDDAVEAYHNGAEEAESDDEPVDSRHAKRDELQKVGDRKLLDPALKAEVVERDGHRCRGCGVHLTGFYASANREIHHTFQVANQLEESRDSIGKADYVFTTVDSNGETINHAGQEDILVTFCKNCHSLTHVLHCSGGKTGISKEEFEKYEPWQKEQLKKCLYFSKILQYAQDKSGRKGRQQYTNHAFWQTVSENKAVDDALLSKREEASAESVETQAEELESATVEAEPKTDTAPSVMVDESNVENEDSEDETQSETSDLVGEESSEEDTGTFDPDNDFHGENDDDTDNEEEDNGGTTSLL